MHSSGGFTLAAMAYGKGETETTPSSWASDFLGFCGALQMPRAVYAVGILLDALALHSAALILFRSCTRTRQSFWNPRTMHRVTTVMLPEGEVQPNYRHSATCFQ